MLTFDNLRLANVLRLPQFKDSHGNIAHAKPDGSDWAPAQWLQAVLGELGEYANVRKKFERGDLTFEQYKVQAEKELADVQTYFSILCVRALDYDQVIYSGENKMTVLRKPHPHGVDISLATIKKFNEVSKRVNSDVFLSDDGRILRMRVAK